MKKAAWAFWVWIVTLVVALFVAGCTCGGGGEVGSDDDAADDDIDDDVDDDVDDDTDDDTDDDVDDDTDDDVDDDADDDADDDTGEPPAAPTNLTAYGVGDRIFLNWKDNSDDENGFYVYRRQFGSSDFAIIMTLGANTTSWQDEVGADKDFEYYITAFNDYGESEPSNIARAQTVPYGPTGLTITSVKKHRVSMSWTDNSQIEVGFKIEGRTESSDWVLLGTVPANTTNFTATGLDCETYYEFRVRAYNNAGDSAPSNIASATTLNCWSIFTVDSSDNVGQWTSIAVDSDGAVHISYYDVTNENLKYATNRTKSWTILTLDHINTVGKYTSIAVDSDDKVHISYHYCAWNVAGYCVPGELKYATDKLGGWNLYVIDSHTYGDIGLYTSIAVDSNNKVHISYFDNYEFDFGSGLISYRDLKYATNKSGVWQVETVDSSGDTGYWTSIALDSNNNVHISYYDSTNGDLKYATNASGSWQTFTLDSTNNVGSYSSIAIDSLDAVHISYYYVTGGDLRYAANESGGWQTFTIDSANNMGQYSSIALDSEDNVHIAYFDSTGSHLKYATNKSGTWRTYTLDLPKLVGSYCDIAIDANDWIHISYYDITNGDLKYATTAEVE